MKFFFLNQLPAIVTMFYVWSSDFINLIAKNLYTFTNLSLFSPPSGPDNNFSLLSFSVFLFFFKKIPHISDTWDTEGADGVGKHSHI